jgi:serine/threonine protein kinase/predicted ATPase
MAEIYLAKSYGAEGLEKTLVIKRILPEHARNERFIEMFISEAKIAVHLNHPNIVQIYDFGKVDGDFYLAMEYVEGYDLGRVIEACEHADEPLPIGDAVFVATEIAKGLTYAHQRKDEYGDDLSIVHRDVSPQNVLVSQDGTVKIVDFGIAKATSIAEESPDVVKGKYGYMSPEQAAGEAIDHRSDLFSLGVVLFEMVCGRPLFRKSSREETISLVKSAVVPDISSLNPDVPPKLEQVLYKVLARDPDDRHDDARDLQVDLTRVLYDIGDIHDSMTLSQHVRGLEQKLDQTNSGAAGLPEERTAMTSVLKTSSKTTADVGTEMQRDTPVNDRAEPAEDEAPVRLLARERKECVIIAGEAIGLMELRSSATDQSRWMQVLQEYTRMVDSIAFKNDGAVHRVNENGFVIVLGVPISSENDAERACIVSMDLQEAIAGMSFSLDSPLQLAMGAAVGEVIITRHGDGRGDFEWEFFGESYQLAEQLAKSAMAKELLLGGQIYRRVRREFECEEIDEVRYFETDGKEQRLTAYRMLERKTQAEQLNELRQSYHSFYGREIPLRVLKDRYRSTLLDGRAGGVLVVGEQGIGKSTLVEEFLDGLAPRDVRAVRGVITPFKRDVPLGAMAEFLSNLMRLGPKEDLRQLREKLRMRVEALFPDEDEAELQLLLHSLGSIFSITYPDSRFRDLEGEERRARVFLSLNKLLMRFAEKKPIVLAIEDAHNIDSVTLEFAAEFLNTRRSAPAFLIGTALNSGPHTESRWWNEFVDAKFIDVEELDELSEGDARSLVRDMLRLHNISDESLVDDILLRSGGNPLFIKEVIEVLRDRGLLKNADERRQLKASDEDPQWLPASVEGLISARIDRLPMNSKLVLQRVSLLWSPFSVADAHLATDGLAEASEGTPGPSVEPVEELERLVAAELLTRVDNTDTPRDETFDPSAVPESDRRYRFCNALTKEVASRTLLPEESRELHGRIAEHLQAMDAGRGDIAVIARHFDEAGETEKAIELYAEAAADALHDFGAAECLRLCAKVLERAEKSDPIYLEILLTEEKALQELGERERRKAALDELEQLVDDIDEPDASIDVMRRMARFFYDDSDFSAAREYIEAARDIANEHDSDLGLAQAWELESLTLISEGHRERAFELLDKAIETFERLIDEQEDGDEHEGTLHDAVEGLANCYNLRGVILRQSGRQREALGAYETALEYAQRGDLRKQERYLLINTGLALVYLGEFGEALDRYNRALEQCEQLGNRKDQAITLVNLGHALFLIGRLDEAIRKIQRGIYLARKTEDDASIADGQISLGLCYLERGDVAAAERVLQEGLRIADSIPNRYLSVHATLAMAEVKLAEGTSDDARIALMQAEDAVERAEDAEMHWGVIVGKSLMARSMKILGRRDEAIEMSSEAVEMLDDGPSHGLEEILYHHTQILPDEDEHREERVEAIRRARELVLERREGLDDPDDREAYANRSINRQILNVAKLVLEG